MLTHVSGVPLTARWILKLLGLLKLHLLQDMTSMSHEDVSMYPQSLLSLLCVSAELTKQYSMFDFSMYLKKIKK
jgi:hypothetical protein